MEDSCVNVIHLHMNLSEREQKLTFSQEITYCAMKIIPAYMKPCCDLTGFIFSSTFPIWYELVSLKKNNIQACFLLFVIIYMYINLPYHSQLLVVSVPFLPLYSPACLAHCNTSTDSESHGF